MTSYYYGFSIDQNTSKIELTSTGTSSSISSALALLLFNADVNYFISPLQMPGQEWLWCGPDGALGGFVAHTGLCCSAQHVHGLGTAGRQARGLL